MLSFKTLCIERPAGTDGNNEVIRLLNSAFDKLAYELIELPFDCTKWISGASFIEQNNNKIEIYPSPFSNGLKGIFPVKYISSLPQLKNIIDFNGILILKDELTQAGLSPKNFPFYFPDEDKMAYEIIEKINPKGIITISGQDPVSGLNPFPVFEDANFEIPSAYVSSLDNIPEENIVKIKINSERSKVKSKQIIYRKNGTLKDIILIAAHMDSKYFTNGAIDNASGTFTLYEIAKMIRFNNYKHTIEIVPFNGEESPEVSGQLAYLEYLKKNYLNIKSVINIDGVGHIGSENMFSFYNYAEKDKKQIITENNLSEGEQWYSGDHSIFLLQEIPCIAVTASNMFSYLMKSIIHTKNDKAELIDIKILEKLSRTIVKILEIIDRK